LEVHIYAEKIRFFEEAIKAGTKGTSRPKPRKLGKCGANHQNKAQRKTL